MKNFYEVTVIDIENQLEVVVELREHDNPEYKFTHLPKQISLFAQTCRPNLIPVVLDLKKMQKRRKNL